MLIHIKCNNHDVTLIERPDTVETLGIELVLNASETRSVTELATTMCTTTLVGKRLLVTTGSHVFLCDNQQIVFEAVAVSEITADLVISTVLAVDERVVLATELELFSLDLRVESPGLIRRYVAASGLIKDIQFDGYSVKVRDEDGNISTFPFE